MRVGQCVPLSLESLWERLWVIIHKLTFHKTSCPWSWIRWSLLKDFGLKHLSAGVLLRSQIQHATGRSLFVSFRLIVTMTYRRWFRSLKIHHQRIAGARQTDQPARTESIDCYPRTLTQAKSLASCIQLTQVIDLHVPHNEILNRIKGRWIHLPSGRVQIAAFKPPKASGKDGFTRKDFFLATGWQMSSGRGSKSTNRRRIRF